MKLHKCSYCDSKSEPFARVDSDLWEATAVINCSCGAKVEITIPTDTYLMRAVPEKILEEQAMNVARDAWNSLHH